MVAGAEQIEFLGLRLEEDEFEQLTVQRHRRALDARCQPADVLHGIGRAGQVMKLELDMRVIDRPLNHLAVNLEERSPERFGLRHCLADRPLEDITVYRTLDLDQQAELPLRTRIARLLREPDVQLPARQR